MLGGGWRRLAASTRWSTSTGLVLARGISSSEVSTALRPFLFLVHPDLFGRHPAQQQQNEKSLKLLRNYVDSLQVAKSRPNPQDVKFYVKQREGGPATEQVLGVLRIRLVEPGLRATLLAILRAAQLSTGYVESLSHEQEEAGEQEQEEIWPWEEEEARPAGYSSTDRRQPVLGWLGNNVNLARARLARHEPIRLETERLQGEISYQHGLEDISWDCGWETVHRRGVVEAFQALVTQYPEVRPILAGRTVVFGKNSGVDTRGHIVLYSGEVRNNWLNVIKTTPAADLLLRNLPTWELTLSQALRGISIVTEPGHSIMVGEYRARILQLVTALGDHSARRSLPASWPASLASWSLAVESDASSLMLSPEGVFVIPASTPGFLIVDFITKGLEEASARKCESVNLEREEQHLVFSCVNELGLIQLDRDESISSRHMVSCCARLLHHAGKLRHLTHGNHLVVARYYMVKSDGVICIPWDLVIDGEGEAGAGPVRQATLHLTMY